ncbi:MAG: glutamine--tRNA ligase, partial [Flavobacterium sp.]
LEVGANNHLPSKKDFQGFNADFVGKELRLKNAYIINFERINKDGDGNFTEIVASYDADSKSGSGSEASNRKVAKTIHWVSVAHAVKAEIRLYDRLFAEESPDTHKDKNFLEFVNPDSLKTVIGVVENSLKEAKEGDKFQFQRTGYFCVDKDSTADKLVFNKTVDLKVTVKNNDKKEENLLNSIQKEVNSFFKAEDKDKRDLIQESIIKSLELIENTDLLINALNKNVSNNKSALLFANFILRHSGKITSADLEKEDINKFYKMSLNSESTFVRTQAYLNLKNEGQNLLNEFQPKLESLKTFLIEKSLDNELKYLQELL